MHTWPKKSGVLKSTRDAGVVKGAPRRTLEGRGRPVRAGAPRADLLDGLALRPARDDGRRLCLCGLALRPARDGRRRRQRLLLALRLLGLGLFLAILK